jgi:flagellar basal-body rod protein FlgF
MNAMYGVNTAVSAAVKRMSQHDYIANNLANAATPGFKAERLTFVRRPDADSMEENPFSHNPVVLVDQSPGTLYSTANPLDVAIQGEGFFVVETPQGEAYTRNGSFTVNKDKELVNQSGDAVMGESGKITITGSKIQIDNKGSVTVDGAEAGKLKIVSFKKTDALQKTGASLFKDSGQAGMTPVEDVDIRSGALEQSNVQVVKEMIDMIDVQRSYEAYLKMMQTISEQDKLSTGRLGKLA